jgi:hypothetical protein
MPPPWMSRTLPRTSDAITEHSIYESQHLHFRDDGSYLHANQVGRDPMDLASLAPTNG